MASRPRRGRPLHLPTRRCSHRPDRTPPEPRRPSPTPADPNVARREGRKRRSLGMRIRSPCRSRNPRKPRARTDGNARTSRRTRPTAQRPEVGRRPRQRPHEEPKDRKVPGPREDAKIPGSARATNNDRRAGSPRREERETACGEEESFEGCSRRWERPRPTNPQGNAGRGPKPGGPHDRQRGATNPRGSLRSKPSRR